MGLIQRDESHVSSYDFKLRRTLVAECDRHSADMSQRNSRIGH